MKKTHLLTLGITFLLVVGCTQATEIAPTKQPAASVVRSTEIPSPTAVNSQRINFTTSGIIANDEIWRDEIHITGDIEFANEATLTIEPGTIIYIASNSDDRQANDTGGCFDEITCKYGDPTLNVGWGANATSIDGRGGEIIAVGTADKPIVFQPEGGSTSTSQWAGLYIEKGSLKYSKLLYGNGLQVLGQSGDVEISFNEIRYCLIDCFGVFKEDVWIHHNIIEGGGHQAMGIQSNNILIEHNIVLHGNLGINIEGDGPNGATNVIVRNNLIIDCGNGISLHGQNVQAVNNTIAHIEGPPDGVYYQGELIYPVKNSWLGDRAIIIGGSETVTTVVNNIIFGEFTDGVLVPGSLGDGSIIDFNSFWGSDYMINDPSLTAVGGSNIEQDPLFVDLLNWDLKLNPESPAIDSGFPNLTDPDGSNADIGAYGGPQADGW